MNLTCPDCGQPFVMDDINIKENIAMCRQCEKVFSISEQFESEAVPQVDITAPPQGAWFTEEADHVDAGATTRSWGALFLIPFTAVWAGGSMGGLYGSQFWNWEFDLAQSLFGIPFLLGSIVLVSLSIMSLCGKINLKIDSQGVQTFVGAFGVGLRKQFFFDEIKSIELGRPNYESNTRQSMGILIKTADKTVNFGTMLNENRRDFLRGALQLFYNEWKKSKK